MTSPLTDAQWNTAKACNSFSLTYTNKKKENDWNKLCLTYFLLNVFFQNGSFMWVHFA